MYAVNGLREKSRKVRNRHNKLYYLILDPERAKNVLD